MSTPKGMSQRPFNLVSNDQVFIYHNQEHIVLQLRRQVPSDQNLLQPSFKVAVKLTPIEALSLASELLTIAAPRIQSATPAAQGPDEKREGDEVSEKESAQD